MDKRAVRMEDPGPDDVPVDCGDEHVSRRELDVGEWRESCEGLPLEHMGRGPDDDPWFFASAFAAGKVARTLVG